jgi:arthrofactin-type cyclic lipopeptide synthetase A
MEQQSICLPRAVEKTAEVKPDAIAVTAGTAQLSYRQLNGRVNQLARQLREMGVARDSVVGLYLERGLALIGSILAILTAG